MQIQAQGPNSGTLVKYMYTTSLQLWNASDRIFMARRNEKIETICSHRDLEHSNHSNHSDVLVTDRRFKSYAVNESDVLQEYRL